MINMCGKFPAGVLLRWREVIGQHRSALPDWLIAANVGDLIPRESLPIPKRDGGTRIPKGSQGDPHGYPLEKKRGQVSMRWEDTLVVYKFLAVWNLSVVYKILAVCNSSVVYKFLGVCNF
jgi:hypothetical protein